MMKANTVIVGASLAGYNTAVNMRNAGYEDPIILVDAEDELPYDRPPLSKGFLLGTTEEDDLRLCTREDLETKHLSFLRGHRVVSVEFETRSLYFEDGDHLEFGNLVIATGATPMNPPWYRGQANVYTLRSLDDARAIRSNLATARKLVVIGGGFVGTEVAASARELGLDVVIVMREELPLQAALGRKVGEGIADLHRSRGVNFRFNSDVVDLIGEDSVTAVQLSDGSSIEADMVLVAIGARPEVTWLERAGLSKHGVPVDTNGRAGDRIWAVGDAVQGEVGHWNSALTQARRVAANICNPDSAPSRVMLPDYFWTDQFQTKIQVLGTSSETMEHIPISGSLSSMDYVGVYAEDEEVHGAIVIARPRALARVRKLLNSKAPLTKFWELDNPTPQPSAQVS